MKKVKSNVFSIADLLVIIEGTLIGKKKHYSQKITEKGK